MSNRITEFLVVLALSPEQMSVAKTKAGEMVCTAWWLEQLELSMDQISSNHCVDDLGILHVEFALRSEQERTAAKQKMATMMFHG